MLEGRCPKCGIRYFGWALQNPEHQNCPKCGVGLKIKNHKDTISGSYSPLTDDKYLLKRTRNDVHYEQNDEELN